ncbi:hypothetical protein GCM10029976_024020 [Kribbella albertanoniae]
MSEVIIATLMRLEGPSGLQSHVRTFDSFLRDQSEPVSVVSPFSARSPFVLPLFAARILVRRISRRGFGGTSTGTRGTSKRPCAGISPRGRMR